MSQWKINDPFTPDSYFQYAAGGYLHPETRLWQLWITFDGNTINWVAAYQSKDRINQAKEELHVINTITSPKRAFMRLESKLAKLCVNHETQGLTLFHGLYPRQASLYPVFLSAPTRKRSPQPSQAGNKRKAQDTLASIKLVSIFVRVNDLL